MNLLNSYREWRKVRETSNELNSLSNRELADLGLSRADIPFVARRAVRGN